MMRVVKNGAGLLDKECPGWYYVVDLEALDMESSYDCILGQVYGSISDAQDRYGYKNFSFYGFDANESDYNCFLTLRLKFEALGEAWKVEIEKRIKENA